MSAAKTSKRKKIVSVSTGKPSSLIDTRVNYIDPPFNSNHNYKVFWGETKEKRAFEDRHASMRGEARYFGKSQVFPKH